MRYSLGPKAQNHEKIVAADARSFRERRSFARFIPIGDNGSGSEIHDSIANVGKKLTTPIEAEQLVEETRIDTLAPAVGNMHGMLETMVVGDTRKRLDIEPIRAIKAETRIFMTLHGASGTDDGDLAGPLQRE